MLYNASPSAPSVAKDLLGRFVFLTGTASLCFAQSIPKDDYVWFFERLIRDQGATELNHERQPCDLSKVSTSVDIIGFVRGELLKQRREYVIALVNLIENDTFPEYRIITTNEYATDIQDRHALSLKIAQEVERNQRAGYGVITVTDAPIPACIVTPSQPHYAEGFSKLLSDQRIKISRKLLPNWQFVEMKVEDAFIAVMRQQCGYVAGEAGVLRTLMGALRRDRKLYEFAPIWFETDQVATLSDKLIRQNAQVKANAEAKRQLDDERNRQLRAQSDAVELKLKGKWSRANALRDRIHNLITTYQSQRTPQRKPNDRRSKLSVFSHSI